MEIFEPTTSRNRWIERTIGLLLFAGVAICIIQPEMGILKKWAQYANQIAIGYWLLGLAFLALKRPRLTLISFAACGFLCIYLKSTTNPNLAQPKPTTEPKISIAQFNLSANNSTYGQTMSVVRQADADILSIHEVTLDWQTWLQDSLHPLYPHRCRVSTPNSYTIELYSKFPFISCDTFYCDNVPNLIIGVRSKTSVRKTYIVSHYLTPPLWNAAYKNMQKQLHDVAMHLRELREPYITVGEYNMEGSSYEIQQFRREAVLKDSRRGFQPMRTDGQIDLSDVPTEHIFYTPHFECLDFQTISGANAERLGIKGVYQFNVDTTNLSLIPNAQR
jgi:endonuclease/exonuclease/phosphatase (EEP) superfamily protein YafD